MKKILISLVFLIFTAGCTGNLSTNIKNAEIVFETRKSINDNPENIYLVDLKGNEFPLPHSGSAFLGAQTVWSLSGDLLAYTDIGQDGQYIVYSDLSGHKTRIGAGYLSSIAPDQKKVTYLTFNDAKNGTLHVSTIELSVLRTLEGFIYTFESMPRTAWNSNDGFYFDHLDKDGIWRIYYYDFSSDGTKLITSGKEPSLSRNGKQLAFIEDESVYIFDLADTQIHKLPNTENSRWPSWSPDDTRIVVSQKNFSSWEICVLTINTLSQKCLTNNKYWDGKPEWKP